MAKKNNFSAPLEDTLPKLSQFKFSDNLEDETKQEIISENEITEPVPKIEKENNSSIEPKDTPVKHEDRHQGEKMVGLEALKIKNSSKRSHFTTTLSEEAQSNIKKMSLALEININDVVENCINAAYQSHEKEIQRLIRKKLL